MEEMNIRCPLCCNEVFDSKQALAKHLTSVVLNVSCPICSTEYPSLDILIQHLNSYTCEEGISTGVSEYDKSSVKIDILPNEEVEESLADNETESIATECTFGSDRLPSENSEVNKMYVELFNKQMKSCLQTQELKLVMEDGENRYVVVTNNDSVPSFCTENTVVTKQNNDGTISLTTVEEPKQTSDLQTDDTSKTDSEDGSLEIYSCNTCGVSFSSVIEHIQNYHNDQDVVVEEPLDETTSIETESEDFDPKSSNQVEIEISNDTVTQSSTDNLTLRRMITDTGNIIETPVIKDDSTAIEQESDQVDSVDAVLSPASAEELANKPAKRFVQVDKFCDSLVKNINEDDKKGGPYHKVIVKELLTTTGNKMKIYSCISCNLSVPTLAEFKLRPCRVLKYPCPHCPVAYENAKSLCAHMKVHKTKPEVLVQPPPSLDFECGICNTVFTTSKSLKLHKRMHDPIKSRLTDSPEEMVEGKPVNDNKYLCVVCEKLIPLEYKAIHQNSHKNTNKFNCHICNRKFSSREYLDMHMNVHNVEKVVVGKQDKSLPYTCLYCNRQFARPHEKVKHERIHTGEKPHSCEICGKSFRVSYCLTLHMRTHTGARPYECQHCGKRFKAHSVYNHHLLTHSEVRAYKCPYCPKAFKTAVQLAGHKNSHTKPFSCQQCNRPFASLYAVRVHMDTHAKQNSLKFSCPLCGASYARAFALKDHVKQAHKPGADTATALKIKERKKFIQQWKRQRRLANECMRINREKQHAILEQLNSVAENEPEVTDEMEYIRIQQIEEEKLQQRKELAKERARLNRERKRLKILGIVDNINDHLQIPGPSRPNLLQDFAIAGSSRNMFPTINFSNNEYRTEHLQPKISFYSSWSKDSSAHIQFKRQFTQNGFGYTCKVCDRLWFKRDLKKLNEKCMQFVKTFLPDIDENPLTVCTTCRLSILGNSIPNMAAYNGFKYPAIPDNLQNCPLDLVSERLISPRIPFTQIRRLRHIHGQFTIYAQIINIPVEVGTMVRKLPRNINNDHCIYVHLERKKIQKTSYVHCLMNKQIVKEWLKYLVNTPLFRTYNINIDETIFDIKHDEKVQSDVSSGIKVANDGVNVKIKNDLCEHISLEERLFAQQQTVMWVGDMNLRTALGESNLPLNLLFEEHAEELSFPSIYLGQFRQFRKGVIVTPFLMANSEIRRTDRRGVTPHHLLYMAMKIIRLRAKDRLPSNCEGRKLKITKEEIESERIESNLAFLRSIPNSTQYWSEKKKDLFALIRQFGKPTVFFTISANEIGWLDLLQLLYKLKKGENISEDAVSQLHFMVKSTLINEDAVTCAIYFNKLINVIMNIITNKKCGPYRKYRVEHFFKRIEFQHHGSPQAHVFAWLDNSPKDALKDDYDKAIDLIDSLISVSAAEASGHIAFQTHKHTFTCYEKNTPNKAHECKFDAPFMPCKKTMILTPMDKTEIDFNVYKKRYAEIRLQLENEDFVDMDDFYIRNGIYSDEDYCNIIRAGIERPKVFVKREPSEKWHYPFNPFILNIVQSHTNFQFITDEYSCAAYVVEYVSKTNRGISHLKRNIIKTVNEHTDFDITDVTKNISKGTLIHTEITSQEAAWYLLREPLSKSSLTIAYIPTVRPTERQRVRKTMREFGLCNDDSPDMWKENWFDKYEKRPDCLEEITLAQFVSEFTTNKKGAYIERSEPRVIRYCNYDMATEFDEYRREMVTLHLPFRDEEEEILADRKFIIQYDIHEDVILQKKKEFESDIDINKIMRICRDLCREETPVNEDDKKDVVNRNPEGNTEQLSDESNDGNTELRFAT